MRTKLKIKIKTSQQLEQAFTLSADSEASDVEDVD